MGNRPKMRLIFCSVRLSEEEMDEIVRDQYIKISQRELQKHVDDLG